MSALWSGRILLTMLFLLLILGTGWKDNLSFHYDKLLMLWAWGAEKQLTEAIMGIGGWYAFVY